MLGDEMEQANFYQRWLAVRMLRQEYPHLTPEQLADLIVWRSLPAVVHGLIDTIENAEDKDLRMEADKYLFESIVGLDDDHPVMQTVLMVIQERG